MAKAVTKSVKKDVVCGVSLSGQELLGQVYAIEIFLDDVPEGASNYFYAIMEEGNFTVKAKVDGKEVDLSKIEFIFTDKTKEMSS